MVEPICFKCGNRMFPKENGVPCEEVMEITADSGEKSEIPYKLWSADLWECSICGSQVVVGFGKNAICESFEKKEYAERIAKIKKTIFKFK